MSENRLNKHCTAVTTESYPSRLSWTPIIVSDSKGRYLKEFSDHRDILFIHKGGWTSSQLFSYLHKNLCKLLQKYNRICLYVWVGTCDFTEKHGRLIRLRPKQSDVLEKLCGNLRGIQDICAKTHRIKLTFLQCPYYSIERWNSFKGDNNSESYKADDQFLTSQIDKLNDYVQDLNTSLTSYSPKLNQDLVRSRKGSRKRQRYSLNFNLFKDGIHPDRPLAKSWFTSINKKIRKDCV